ncbi:WbqC family protein [Silanimonas algicola]
MRVGIMQPYFLPYVGYFQLMAAVDVFVVYDDIKYTKSGWINRNRILVDGREAMITVPIARGSDSLDVRDRRVSDAFDRPGLLRRIEAAYSRSPAFAEGMRLARKVIECEEQNLFCFINHSIHAVRDYFGLSTALVVSSSLGVDRSLAGQDRVIATCEAIGGTTYINPVGGADLYSKAVFAERGIALEFSAARLDPYAQKSPEFVPALSIIDLIMNVRMPEARSWLGGLRRVARAEDRSRRCIAH